MTIFAKVKAWFQKFFGSEQAWEKTALGTLTVVGPLIQTAVVLIDPAAEPEVASVLATVKSDLATAAAMIDQGVATPTLTGVLADISNNLGSLLTAVQVKDPATQQKVAAMAQTVISAISDVQAEMPATAKGTAAPASGSAS